MKLALLSGFFIGTSYIPSLPWALVFGLVPLWIQWEKNPSAKKVFWSGWLTQFTFTIIGFHWIAHTAIEYGHLPIPLGILVGLGFGAINGLHFPASGLLWVWLKKRFRIEGTRSRILLALIYWVMETWIPMLFPYHWGYPWIWAQVPLYQTADIFGFDGLSLFTILLNVASYEIYTQFRANRSRALKTLAGAVTAIMALCALGLVQKASLPTPDAELKVLAVQGNIGNLDKALAERGAAFREPILQKYFDLTDQGIQLYPDSDLIFFPETAIPIELDPVFLQRHYPTRFLTSARKWGKTVLVGAYSSEAGSSQVYNGIFLFNRKGEFQGSYRKTILLAFGEYFPGAKYFPILKKIVPEISDFRSNDHADVLKTQDLGEELIIGPQVCYEGLHPWLIRDFTNLGAQIFFNVTNDSWYGRPFEPYQHLYMTLARAIEFRRPLMRVTNTGYTTGILADGTLLPMSGQNVEWVGQFKIPYLKAPPTTIYQRFGHYYPFLALLGILVLVLRSPRRKS